MLIFFSWQAVASAVKWDPWKNLSRGKCSLKKKTILSLSVCLCLSVCLSFIVIPLCVSLMSLFLRLSQDLPYLPVSFCIHQSLCVCLSLYVCLCVHLFLCLPACLSLSLYRCLSVSLPLNPSHCLCRNSPCPTKLNFAQLQWLSWLSCCVATAGVNKLQCVIVLFARSWPGPGHELVLDCVHGNNIVFKRKVTIYLCLFPQTTTTTTTTLNPTLRLIYVECQIPLHKRRGQLLTRASNKIKTLSVDVYLMSSCAVKYRLCLAVTCTNKLTTASWRTCMMITMIMCVLGRGGGGGGGGGGLVVMTITLGVRGCGAEPGTVLMLMCVLYC